MKNLFKISFFTFFSILSITQSGIAQNYGRQNDLSYKAGQVELQAGLGLVSTYVSMNAKTKIPPVSLTLNYRFKDFLSVGAYFGYSSTGYDGDMTDSHGNIIKEDEFSLRNNFYLTGIRFQGHYSMGQVDFYGGAMLGYNFSRISTNISDPKDQPEGILIEEGNLITYSGFIGLKYITPSKLGFYGEIGYGASLITIGLTYRL
jgi:hypothetical protein